jgi:hypothetical protein
MKPPICEVCDGRFAPSDGGLVQFAPTESGQRHEQEHLDSNITGHHPDVGWFCADHVTPAEELASSHTLRAAVDIVRRSMPSDPEASSIVAQHAVTGSVSDVGVDRWTQRFEGDDPICLSCGQAFVAATGGRALFRVDAAGHAWNARSRQGDVDQPRPYDGWFCNRHIGPAQLVSRALSRSEAMPLLAPNGRPPLEYRQHPAGIEIEADPFGEPARAPFVPVDDGFEPDAPDVVVLRATISPRIRREVHTALTHRLASIAEALGVDHLRLFGSNSIGGSSFSSYQGDDLSVFTLGGDRCGVIIQQRERTILDVRVRAAAGGRTTPDGLELLERIEVRHASDRIARRMAESISALITELAEASADSFDPVANPSTDLHGGVIERGRSPGSSFVRWVVDPIDVDSVAASLESLTGPLAELLDLTTVPHLTTRNARTWHPEDGARPPDCPYTDRTTSSGSDETAGRAVSVALETASSHRGRRVHHVSASLAMRAGTTWIVVSASGSDGTTSCTQISLRRPVVDGTIELLAAVFGLDRA